MNQAHLTAKLAKLETIDDQIESELHYLDRLLKLVGFEDGIESLKAAVAINEVEEDLV